MFFHLKQYNLPASADLDLRPWYAALTLLVENILFKIFQLQI